jgi:tetratricopeptide (TPR) repeat protein
MTTSNIPAVTQAASERPLIAPRRKTDDEKRGLLARLKQANPAKWFEHEDTKTLAPVAIPPPAIPQPPVEPAGRVAPPLQRPPVLRYEHHKDMPVTKGNRTLAQKYFAKAAAAHQQRRLPEAISLYRQAIAADPSYFEPSYNLGLAAYQNKDLPLALAANEQAVAVNPTSADARYNFALTLREAHYYTDAANELRQLADMSPNDPRAQLALANLYAQQLDEAALARTHYQRFLELAPNHPEAAIVRQWLGAR